jgi:hypothetical protein
MSAARRMRLRLMTVMHKHILKHERDAGNAQIHASKYAGQPALARPSRSAPHAPMPLPSWLIDGCPVIPLSQLPNDEA